MARGRRGHGVTLYCEAIECIRPAFRSGHCETHVKQLQRHGITSRIREHQSPEDRLIEACHAFAECSSDDEGDYEAKRKALLRAGIAWMRARGWSPPKAEAYSKRHKRTSQRMRRRSLKRHGLRRKGRAN